jgi:SRSO17 transposase
MSTCDEFSWLFKTAGGHAGKHASKYLKGLIQARAGAKNMERMEEVVEGMDYEATQHFISDSPWSAREVIDEVARKADDLLGGHPSSRLVIDETAFSKKGRESVGVARQYNGRLGKVDNCQVAVCASLASGQMSTLVDMRLYLPQEWIDAPHRLEKAGVPEAERHMRSKCDLALESVRHSRELGLRFECVSFDAGYGKDTGFLCELEAMGERFIGEVHCDRRVWLEAPFCHQQSKRAGGKPLVEPRPSTPSHRVDEWVQSQPLEEWRRFKVRDSDQGWVEVRYLARRVWVAHHGQEYLWWLLAWEDAYAGQESRIHYALSNHPADTDERLLVELGAQRNVVERNFREAKNSLGMADYQVRGWDGLHHHMALVLLAMLFVLREKMLNPMPPGSDAPGLTAGDILWVLEHYLPTRARDRSRVIETLKKRRMARAADQRNRKTRAQRERPPLWPDEVPTLPK